MTKLYLYLDMMFILAATGMLVMFVRMIWLDYCLAKKQGKSFSQMEDSKVVLIWCVIFIIFIGFELYRLGGLVDGIFFNNC